jgi:hypothetical protein
MTKKQLQLRTWKLPQYISEEEAKLSCLALTSLFYELCLVSFRHCIPQHKELKTGNLLRNFALSTVTKLVEERY